jgi:pSer/pThr/pTyr-binding forkhead associated (FHA) protein
MIMVATHRKLLALIQELNQLIAEDYNQSQFFQKVAQALARITLDLDSDKRNVCVISFDLALAQSFHQLLNSYQTLEETYQFQLHRLPLQPSQAQKSVPPASLTLQALTEENGLRQVRYELSSRSVLDVGRQPECDVYVPDDCTRVSGRHLEVQVYSAEDAYAPPQWRVQNAEGCKNGTFINGEPLAGSRILRSGDRLILGDTHLTAKSPALIFESQLELDELEPEAACLDRHESQSLENLANCDILLLVIDSHREFQEEEKKLLEAAKATAVFDVFLVISLKTSTEVVNISRQPHALITVEGLSHAMSSIDHKQNSSVKAKRALTQVLLTIESIEQMLLIEQGKIKQEIQTVKHQHSQANKQNSATDITSLVKVINEQKISYVKAIETSFGDAKHDLLDDSLADSMQQKIQDLIDALQAHVVKQEGKKYLELRAAGSEANVNDFIVELCKEELLEWANEEWRKIRKCYGNGGLEGLAKSSNVILKTICEKSNAAFEFHVKQRIAFEEAFQSALRRIPCRLDYQEDPVFIYFVKKIRSSVFQVMGILFLLSFLGLSRGSFMRAIVSRVTGSPLLLLLALGMIVWLMYKLYKTYQADRAAEVRKASEKIRQELRNYYQKLVKNRFAEKLTQSLEASLKEEISRLDESIKAFVHTTAKTPTESGNGQMDFKAFLKDGQSRHAKLERRLKDFQKVKDKLQRLGDS